MKPSMLYEALLALIGERVPLHIWGACGAGKSEIVSQVADELDYEFLDVRAVQNSGQALVALGKRNLIGQIGSPKRLNEQKSQRCRLSPNRARRKLAIAEQMNLILANMVWPKLIGRPVEIPGELVHRMHVGANGVRRVVTTLELIQHPLAKTGHRKTSL
jgi:hypothetical protein